MNHTLYTFGCSWTAGVGVGYDPSMSVETYQEQARIESIMDKFSFRGLLKDQFGIENINFSAPGGSNDSSFRQLSKMLGDKTARKNFLDTNPVILFGITSTARIERASASGYNNMFLGGARSPSVLYFLDDNYIPVLEDFQSLLSDQGSLYTALHLKLFYNHEKEIVRLYNSMCIWNEIFEKFNIPILWYDTFNHHEYPGEIDNFFAGKDLLSEMLNFKKIEFNQRKKWYHFSDWSNDDPRITAGMKNDLLNPFTKHPTMVGHDIISQILYPSVKKLIE